MEIKIQEKILNIDKAFDLAMNRSSWANGNYHTGKHLFSIINELNEINNRLIDFYRTKFYDREIQVIKIFHRQSDNLSTKLKKHAKTN